MFETGVHDRFDTTAPVIAGLDPAIVRSQARIIAKEVQLLCRYTYSGLQANRNCVTARWGGEQREATESSVAKANSIRPYRLASLRRKGAAQACERKHRRPMPVRG